MGQGFGSYSVGAGAGSADSVKGEVSSGATDDENEEEFSEDSELETEEEEGLTEDSLEADELTDDSLEDEEEEDVTIGVTTAVLSVGLWLPFSPFASALGFVALPAAYWPLLIGIVTSYLLLTQLVKTLFVRRGWL